LITFWPIPVKSGFVSKAPFSGRLPEIFRPEECNLLLHMQQKVADKRMTATKGCIDFFDRKRHSLSYATED
jgi:hypothetical protein